MVQRPLSPFLHYRWRYTNAFSLCHRLTGVTLFLGFVLLVTGLRALSRGEASFDRFIATLARYPLRLLFALCSLAFLFHLGNGIRHLAWDMGFGLERAQARRSARWLLLFLAVAVAGGAGVFARHSGVLG